MRLSVIRLLCNSVLPSDSENPLDKALLEDKAGMVALLDYARSIVSLLVLKMRHDLLVSRLCGVLPRSM